MDVTDEHFHKLIFYTDGRQVQKSQSGNTQEIAAHWNGSQLVSDEKGPQGGRMSRTFELSKDGRQVYETIVIERPKSRGSLNVRYVYEIGNSNNQQGVRDTDPDKPVLKRHADGGDSTQSPQGGQTAPQPQTTPQQQTAPQPQSDPDQPVMKRRSGTGNSSFQ